MSRLMQNRRVASLVLAILMVLSCFMFFKPVTVSASNESDIGVSTSTAYTNLMKEVMKGKYQSVYGDKRSYDFTGSSYKSSEGGYWTYTELFDSEAATVSHKAFDSGKIDTLKASQKQKFIENVITIANAIAYDSSKLGTGGLGVTSDTVNILLEKVQNECGMGSEVLAAVLNDTQPDYTTASRIWKPFSGPVSTAIGVLAIAMMSLLGLTMALDIAYVVIPAFQMLLDGDSEGGQQSGATKGLSRIVSKAARDAVKETQGGGQGGSDTKSQIGTYFKKRWKELIVIGFCLLYLIQGQIWSLISWIINLVSGVLD